MPFPPYLGSKAGCTLITLFGNSFNICSGNFHRNPAKTIKSGFEAFKTFKTSSVFENAILLNDKALTFNFFARSKTLAWGLLVST